MVTLKKTIAMSLMLVAMVSLFSQNGIPLTADYYAEYLGSNNRDCLDGIKNTIVDTVFIALDQFSHAVMYIAPYGDPLSTFIYYGTPPPSGMSDLVGDGYSFEYSCNTSQRAYYTIPLLDNHVGYLRDSVTFKIFQANCYGNFESNTFPIWYDGDPYFMMLAHVQYDLPFSGSSFFPDFVENTGVLSDNNAVGWREIDVTNAYNHAISNGWQNFQLMLYFEILSDWDYATDQVLLPNPNYTQYAPHLIVTYIKDVSIDDEVSVPMVTSKPVIYNNYPNPFNPLTTIEFSIPQTGRAKLSIFNLRGQKVKTLLDGDIERGLHRVVWDGREDGNRSVASGVYFIRLEAAGKTSTRKAMLLK